jgi:hypothetical protein
MAKKQKRNVSQSAVSSTARTAVKTPPVTYSSSPRPVTSMEFNPDYTFVKQDLKRIGITAASFIAALFVLYLIITYLFPNLFTFL